MKYNLSNELAQKIVTKMMSDINFNINIMNHQGIIIASGDQRRIGTLHKGAQRAIKHQETSTIYHQTETEKKGINTPIKIGNKLIGVVGISGEPEEVIIFEKVVNTMVKLLIEQEVENEQKYNDKRVKERFLLNLLLNNVIYSNELKEKARSFHLDLELKTQVIMIRGKCDVAKIRQLLPVGSHLLRLENNRIVLLIQEPMFDSRLLSTKLLKAFKDITIAISDEVDTIHLGYVQANSSIDFLKKMRIVNHFVNYQEIAFYATIIAKKSQFNNGGVSLGILQESPILFETLKVYLNENQDIKAASDILSIHRNTLKYRLNRIAQLTGKDPENIFDLFELLVSILVEDDS